MSCSKEDLELLEGRSKHRITVIGSKAFHDRLDQMIGEEARQWLPMPKHIDWRSIAIDACKSVVKNRFVFAILNIQKGLSEQLRDCTKSYLGVSKLRDIDEYILEHYSLNGKLSMYEKKRSKPY